MLVVVAYCVFIAAICFVGAAIVGAGMRISRALIALVDFLQDVRQHKEHSDFDRYRGQ